jgi:flagellum-specific ATP synthase
MNLFERYRQLLRHVQPLGVSGRVSAVRGLTVSVGDFPSPIGAACRIASARGELEGCVVGLADQHTLVMPLGATSGIRRGDRVWLAGSNQTVALGPGMLGRVLDGRGRPIDGRGPLKVTCRYPVWPEPMDPMQRRRIGRPLATGLRAIDGMLTVGRGQRMGVLSGSGVGKSVLLGMISRHSSAEVAVIALIGERGREVRDFIDKELGPEGLKKSVVIVSTSDEPPPLRVQAGAVATAVAEYFRDRGCDVVLLVDSLTRLATAQRQIGLAAGEPPATKGYTPSVFNLLPQLLERTGRTEEGSVTAFYAVLAEADDQAEPISDAVRAVTDGHIWLSRQLAQRGHYPAIDCLQSVSRVMIDVAEGEHLAAAAEIRRLMALYAEIEDMVTIGAYQGGGSEYDLAVKAMPLIRAFLDQPIERREDFDDTVAALKELCRRIARMRQGGAGATT